MPPFWLVAVATLLAVIVAMAVTAVASRRLGKVSVVDVTWGLLFVVIAWTACAVAGGAARSLLLAVLVTVWGGRLAWHLAPRMRGGEDPRYAAMMRDVPPERRLRWAIRRVFAVQGVIAWFVALPIIVAATTDRPIGSIAWLGLVLYAAGLAFEAIGDAQLRAFKADPANRGAVMDRGLWSWTRHPNYFGDALVTWGIFVIAAEAWPGVLTILSPILMTHLLVNVSGAKLLEKTMMQRPGYPEYASRTSMFVPRPPKRG